MDVTAVGAAIRAARVAAGLTLEQLGEAAGYSAASISRLERGLQSTRDTEVLRRVAAVLAMPPASVGLASPTTGHLAPKVMPIREGGGWVDRRTVLTAILAGLGAAPLAGVLPEAGATTDTARLVDELRDRFLRPAGRPRTIEQPNAANVADAIRRVQRGYAGSDFRALARALPEAIDLAQAHHTAARGGEQERAAALLSQTYASAASTCIKLGRLDLAWIAADRANLTAQATDDALTHAEAARQISILCRKAGRPGDTMTIAAEAAERLRERGLSSPDHVSTHGLLLLSAAYAAAADGQRDRCMDLLADAGRAADLLDGRWHGGFGTVNIDIYRVSVEWALGDAGNGITFARRVADAGPLPTAERAERFWVDTARAWQRVNRPVECFRALLNAERCAPQAVRVRPVVHSVATWLLSAPTTVGMAGLREFATRVAAA